MLIEEEARKNIEIQRNRFLWLWAAPMSLYGYALIVFGPVVPFLIALPLTVLHIKIGGYKGFSSLPSYLISTYVIATVMPVVYLLMSFFSSWKDHVYMIAILYLLSIFLSMVFAVLYKRYKVRDICSA